MSRYRKIDPRIHGDAKFKRLSPPQPCGQYLFLYLLTCPFSTNVPGLLPVGPAGLAEKLGWPLEGFLKAFGEVLAEGLVEYDEKAVLITIPNAIKHNPPESPNVVKSWETWLDEAPECDLKDKHIQRLKGFLEAFGKGFAEAFPKGFALSRARTRARTREETGPENSKDSLSIPQKTDTVKSSQAENPVDPTPPGRPGSGSGISKAGDVAAGLVGDTGKTAAIFADPRPLGAEHDEILNLRQLHAKRFNYDLNPCAPVGDLSCRILDALREYGLKKCRAAIEGHFKEATKEGSSRGKGFEHAFPPLGRQKNKLDRDRFWTLITAGQKGSGKSARSTFVAQPKLSDAEQEAAAKKRKEILAEMGIGRPSE